MSKMKLMLLSGAALLAAGNADAANTKVYGGGSSLISVYMVQAFNCYGNPQQLIIRSPLSLKTINPFNYTGTKGQPMDCSTEHVVTNASLFFDSAGSGVGIAGIFSHDPSSAAPNGYGDIDPNQSGEQNMSSISYGMSDAGLSATDVGFYNNGNDDQGPTNPCTVKEQQICVVAPGETAHPPTTYPNPAENYGPLIQFPVSVDPVAVAYDPVYKKVTDSNGVTTSYRFNIKFAHADGSGGWRLDQNAYCTIFNGIFATGGSGPITNWNDSRLKALNGGQSLKDPTDPDSDAQFSVTLQITGRSDSSGTTSIFTRHLARVCGTTGINLQGNQYADGATTLPANLQGGTYDGTTATGVVPGKFTLANGNNLVAKYVAFTAVPANNQTLKQGNIGYLGSDFVAPASNVNGNNNFNLSSADLKNAANKFVAATGDAAATAFGSIAPPQSTAAGHYDHSSCPGAASKCRSHPYDWVEPVSKTSQLADPQGNKSYPIVGTTNALLYTCYKNAKTASVIKKFFSWYIKDFVVQEVPDGLLTKNGLASLPTAWRTAINETFLKDTSGLGLAINKGGADNCAGIQGG